MQENAAAVFASQAADLATYVYNEDAAAAAPGPLGSRLHKVQRDSCHQGWWLQAVSKHFSKQHDFSHILRQIRIARAAAILKS